MTLALSVFGIACFVLGFCAHGLITEIRDYFRIRKLIKRDQENEK